MGKMLHEREHASLEKATRAVCSRIPEFDDVLSIQIEFARRPTYTELREMCEFARARGLRLTVSPSGGVVLRHAAAPARNGQPVREAYRHDRG